MSSTYASRNYLTSGQKKLFKKLDSLADGRKILTSDPIKNSGYFVSAGSLSGLNSKRVALKTLLDDALDLTKLLFSDSLYDPKNNKETARIRKAVSDLIEGVKNTIDGALSNDLDEATLATFAKNLNNRFIITEGGFAENAVKDMVTYGVFAGVYKKVIAMMKNYNPFSRTSKGNNGKQGLGKMGSLTASRPEETVIAKTIEDKSTTSQWILNHINTSLPICCIDKLICITNDISNIHKLLGSYVAEADKLNDVVGGTPLSYFSYISFYYSEGTGTLNDARKLRPKIYKETEGWVVKGLLYPERLNLDNEVRRSRKSITQDENRAYDVFIIVDGKVTNAKNLSGSTNIGGNIAYKTEFEKPIPIPTTPQNPVIPGQQ